LRFCAFIQSFNPASCLFSLPVQLRENSYLNQAKVLFNTYVTGFGAGIVAYVPYTSYSHSFPSRNAIFY
jgi:hypothetical protein